MPERRDLALQAIAGRTRLVAEQRFAVSAGQLADEAPDCLWRVVDLAEEADLALAALLGQGDRDLQLGGIQTDKHFAFLRHGSSLVRKARRRPIRNNPGSSHRGDEPPPPATNIRSAKTLEEARARFPLRLAPKLACAPLSSTRRGQHLLPTWRRLEARHPAACPRLLQCNAPRPRIP